MVKDSRHPAPILASIRLVCALYQGGKPGRMWAGKAQRPPGSQQTQSHGFEQRLMPSAAPLPCTGHCCPEDRARCTSRGAEWVLGALGCQPWSVSCLERPCGVRVGKGQAGSGSRRWRPHTLSIWLACQQCLHYFLTSMAIEWPLGRAVQAGDPPRGPSSALLGGVGELRGVGSLEETDAPPLRAIPPPQQCLQGPFCSRGAPQQPTASGAITGNFRPSAHGICQTCIPRSCSHLSWVPSPPPSGFSRLSSFLCCVPASSLPLSLCLTLPS